MTLIRSHVDSGESPDVPLGLDLDAYALRDQEYNKMKPCVVGQLPPKDHALYLIQNVNFHITQTLHLFDNKSLRRNIEEFYAQPEQPLSLASRLSYIQFLIIIAFGKAMLYKTSGARIPSGYSFFERALELLPAVDVLYRHVLLSVETLCS